MPVRRFFGVFDFIESSFLFKRLNRPSVNRGGPSGVPI